MISIGEMLARAVILAGLSPLLCACATKFQAADATRIRTIAVSKIEEPKYYAYSYFVMRQDPVNPSGPEDFNALMERQNLHLGAELAAGVTEALRRDGYEIADSSQADAVMSFTITGTIPGQPGPTYSAHGAALEPEFTVKAKLTEAKTNKTLFEQLYLYGNNSIKPMDGSILLVPDQKYYFTSGKEMLEKPEVAAAGFRSVVPLISENIATAFKKP